MKKKGNAQRSITSGTAILIACILITGCMTRSFIFNGVPYPDPISANVAVETFYSKLERDVTPASSQIPKTIIVVVPSQIYARTHWIVKAGMGSLTEDQYQFIANQLIRDCRSLALT